MSAQEKKCPRCGLLIGLNAVRCPGCGRSYLPPPINPNTEACAKLSVVFGGIAFVLFRWGVSGLPEIARALYHVVYWFSGVAGLVLGIISLLRLRANPRLSGRRAARIGIALSVAPVAFGVYLFTTLWRH